MGAAVLVVLAGDNTKWTRRRNSYPEFVGYLSLQQAFFRLLTLHFQWGRGSTGARTGSGRWLCLKIPRWTNLCTSVAFFSSCFSVFSVRTKWQQQRIHTTGSSSSYFEAMTSRTFTRCCCYCCCLNNISYASTMTTWGWLHRSSGRRTVSQMMWWRSSSRLTIAAVANSDDESIRKHSSAPRTHIPYWVM